MSEKEIRHPSFGVITFHAVSSSQEMPFFGSSVPHNHWIELSIDRAILKRDLTHDFIMPAPGGISDISHAEIVSVYLSYTQFAEAITTIGKGEGTPCTIHAINGERIQQPPQVNRRVQFDEEFEKKMNEITNKTNPYFQKILKLLNEGKVSNKLRDAVLDELDSLQMQIDSNLPYMKKEWTESMDKTVLEAKNDFEAFVDTKVKSLGLEGFKKELVTLQKSGLPALESKAS